MQTPPALTVGLTLEDVTRAWGDRHERLSSPAMRGRVKTILEQIREDELLEPAFVYRIVEVTDRNDNWLGLSGRERISSPLVAHRLRRASHLVFGACTIGHRLLQRVSELFTAGQSLQAVMLDEVGTLALYKLSEHLEEVICAQAAGMGKQASGALNPGEEGFVLEQQERVLRLAGGGEIGIVVKGGGVLVPQKSITTVIGYGEQMPGWSRGESCAACKSRERCPYRQDRSVAA